MKRKQVEKLPPPMPRKIKTGRALTAQEAGEVLVINIWEDSVLEVRYCINCRTGEYENLKNGNWSIKRFADITDLCYTNKAIDKMWDLKKYRSLAEQKVGIKHEWDTVASRISSLEYGYGCKKRERAYDRKTGRIDALMDMVPPLPDDLETWYLSLEGDTHYLLKDGDTAYRCMACGGSSSENAFGRRKPKHGQYAVCPLCHARVPVNKRKGYICRKGNIMLLQKLDETKSVARHFDAAVEWGGRETARVRVGSRADCI